MPPQTPSRGKHGLMPELACMCDIETLSTQPDAAIITIGAVMFAQLQRQKHKAAKAPPPPLPDEVQLEIRALGKEMGKAHGNWKEAEAKLAALMRQTMHYETVYHQTICELERLESNPPTEVARRRKINSVKDKKEKAHTSWRKSADEEASIRKQSLEHDMTYRKAVRKMELLETNGRGYGYDI